MDAEALAGVKRLLVIGSCGAGKSVLTRRLCALTGLPAIHLDALYWQPGWAEPEKSAFDVLLSHACAGEKWIMDGTYVRTLPMRLRRAEAVIYLRYPRRVCLLGILRRIFLGRFRPRPDMAPGCPERLDFSFLRYCWNFEKAQTPKIAAALADYHGRVIVFHSRKETETFCARLKRPLDFNA